MLNFIFCIRPQQNMLEDLIGCFCVALKNTINDMYLNYSAMTREEALEILDVSYNKKQIDARFQELYHKNSVKNGGSPYLQGIIKNAYEFLRREKN